MKLTQTIWRYRRDYPNELSDYLLLFPEAGHWVNLNVLTLNPERYVPYGGWMIDHGEGHISICLKGGTEWKNENYRNLGEMLQWCNVCGRAFDLDLVSTGKFPTRLMGIAEKFLLTINKSEKPELPNKAVLPTAVLRTAVADG